VTDVVTPEKRSKMMSGIQGKNTKPEMIIRNGLHTMGFRYRLHGKNLPGKPDLVFSRYKAVIFIHGCFWHCHKCHLFKWPSTRTNFWKQKISGNIKRDQANMVTLTNDGWRVLVIWECSLKGRTRLPVEKLLENIAAWLKTGTGNLEIRGGMTDGTYGSSGLDG
jgi:DNA mismatch endonuclease (patch repair protein)